MLLQASAVAAMKVIEATRSTEKHERSSCLSYFEARLAQLARAQVSYHEYDVIKHYEILRSQVRALQRADLFSLPRLRYNSVRDRINQVVVDRVLYSFYHDFNSVSSRSV